MRHFLGVVLAVATISFISYPTLTSAPGEPIVFRPLLARHAKVLFGGDMMFDRFIRHIGEERGEDFIFSCVKEELAKADLVVANLEGPITEHPSMSLGSVIGSPENFTFTFPTSTATLLERHNIRLVNLGNNHLLNFGWEGASSTKSYLRDAGVEYFGLPATPGAAQAGDPREQNVAYIDLKGVKLAFITYNEFAPEGWRENASTTISQIGNAKARSYIPVVYTHWGDEYVIEPGERIRGLARSFVDEGAKLVVGSHPHVVQGSEEYRGAHIYYSLGNFIFDQYWSEEVRNGLLLKTTFDANGVVGVEEFPIDGWIDRGPCVVPGGLQQA